MVMEGGGVLVLMGERRGEGGGEGERGREGEREGEGEGERERDDQILRRGRSTVNYFEGGEEWPSSIQGLGTSPSTLDPRP